MKAKLDEARALLEDLRDDPAPLVEDLLEATGLLAEAVGGLPDWVWDRADRRPPGGPCRDRD